MLRIEVKNSVLDVTGVCVAIKRELVVLQIQTGLDLNEIKEVKRQNIEKVTEILSSPLFHRLKRTVSGSQAGIKDLQ